MEVIAYASGSVCVGDAAVLVELVFSALWFGNFYVYKTEEQHVAMRVKLTVFALLKTE